MLNRKPDASSVSSHDNITSQREPKMSVVPDVENGSHNANKVDQSELLFLGNEAIRLSRNGMVKLDERDGYTSGTRSISNSSL